MFNFRENRQSYSISNDGSQVFRHGDGCEWECEGGCSWECADCTSCTGCSGGCDGCSGCGSGCAYACEGECGGDCEGCTGCGGACSFGCTGCSGCGGCGGCSGCSGCGGCGGCSGCSGSCGGCGGCSGCSGCGTDCSSGCSTACSTDCTGCTSCEGCSGCTSCEGCSGCTSCEGCSGCSGCTSCSADCADDCSYYCGGCTSCSGCWGCGDCGSGCYGNCYTGCSTNCYSGCNSGCTGCSGCYTGCSGCSGVCQTSCENYCAAYCQKFCQTQQTYVSNTASNNPGGKAFSWTTTKLSATDWNNLASYIEAAQKYCSTSTAAITRVTKGNKALATNANSLITGLKKLTSTKTAPGSESTGNKIDGRATISDYYNAAQIINTLPSDSGTNRYKCCQKGETTSWSALDSSCAQKGTACKNGQTRPNSTGRWPY